MFMSGVNYVNDIVMACQLYVLKDVIKRECMYFPWLYYEDLPIVSIRSNSVEVRVRRPWSYTMSKQPNVELTIVTAKHSRKEETGQTQETNRLRQEQRVA